MKVICNRQELTSAVSNVQYAVSSKSSIPALEGILIKADKNAVTVCGYDLDIGITTEIEASVSEAGSVVLNARLFSDIVRRLPGEKVELNADEKSLTTITSGNSEFSISGIPSSEYPELPMVTDTVTFSISCNLLKSMIRQTIFAVAESDNNPVHTGSLFEIDGGTINLVSVDGFRLAIRTEKINCDESMKFVVPGKALSEVCKLLPDEEKEVTLKIGRRHVLFLIENYVVMSRLLEGDFIDYHAAIPKVNTSEIRVETRAFSDSVERISLLINDRRRIPVRCIFEGEEIRISCETEVGRANDQLPAEITGEGVEMGFNNRYLLDALKNVEDDEVKIQLNGPLSPMKIMPSDGNAFLFLVLPVRL